ncbi:PA0069 family radical SAM protein [Noviherbaspirillum sp. CPCC 100848]|uniref:PA0069 family radical SAM protein n=1 Tax=Noviherbaspirillum album TaxID=3080276 RepID=A0ABU6JFL3_9BURK|nr:PA0069 family radical SAM protein [Noviherbaspirillum sp. CPCC 100848]MEC4722453.1 PA0069 family radical SAM protein [Noviherbaspirillum sp. CPCC 100848]
MKERNRDGRIDAEPVQVQVQEEVRPWATRKGRGAVSNMQGRYETQLRSGFDDGWHSDDVDHDAFSGAPGTRVFDEQARTILTRNASPDIPFNVSLNPYRGCEHGCIYCFARPTHSYLGLSPGLDFETQVFAKVNAPDLLRRELAAPSYTPEPIAIGVNTDAYQPCERDLKLTRRILEVLRECEHPLAVITKSSMVERDIDLLAPMAARRQAVVAMTITTLDPAIARTLEPRATAPARRLRTIRTLTEAGIPVGVSIAPVIPFVTEPDLERILVAAAEAGAASASYIVLRLPWEVNPLFQQWLQAHFPERAQRVMNRIRDMRGGKDYDADFGRRMRGEGVWADLIRQRFDKLLARLGLDRRADGFARLDGSAFRRPLSVPPKCGTPGKAANGQLDLF